MYVEKNTASLCKKPSLNLHTGASMLEKWVRRSTRCLQEDASTTPGTVEELFQKLILGALTHIQYLSLFSTSKMASAFGKDRLVKHRAAKERKT